jgi:hypothetical protein
MNIIIDISNYNLGYTYFLDSKRNMVIEGTFSKIVYSNQYFTLNGIYIHLPFEVDSIDRNLKKYILKFYPSSKINTPIVQELNRMEHKIIEYFKQMNGINHKKSSYSLTKQLFSGSLKVYKDYTRNITSDSNITYVIIISGIWETCEEVGITYKVVESSPV